MTNIRMPDNQFLHNDYFTSPTQGAFPIKLQYPNQLSSHMKTAHADSKDILPDSPFLWMNHFKTLHSQGHSLTELSYVQGNQMESWPQHILTDNSMQKELIKNGSLMSPGSVSSECNSEQIGFFSGSATSHPKIIDPGHPDSVQISTGHNLSAKKAAFLDGRQLPNNAMPGPPNTKLTRKSVANFSEVSVREPLGNAAGKLKTDLPNPTVLAHKTKTGFPDQSDKGFSSVPTPWSYEGIRSMPTSSSVPFLTPSMSLSSPVPIVCSSLGEDSLSCGSVTKQDATPYPTDAHSAPPMDACSNTAQSMRPPSAPVSTRPGPKSPFCCDECTKSGGTSEKCSNTKCKLHFSKLSGNLDSARSNLDHPTPSTMAGRQKTVQSAFTSQNSNHLLHRGSCSQNSTTSSASSPLVSPSYHPLPSVIKCKPSPRNSISTNAAITHSGASPFCFSPPNTSFMHSNDSPYNHKMPPFYQASSYSNAPKTSSNNSLTYTNHNPSSHSNNNVTVDKPTVSLGIPVNTKAGRTVSHVPEDLTKLQHQRHPSMSSSSKRKLTHVCFTPNLVAPLYTSSIYTCSSNTSTFSSSTQSNQSQLNTESAYNRYSNHPPTFPAPPSYSEVIQQKNNSLKNHDLLASQQMGGCKKLLWQPFSDEKPMVRIKTEVVTGTYPGEVQMPSQLPSSSSAPFGQSAFQDPQLATSDKDQFPRQPLASPGHFLPQAMPQASSKRPLHSPDTCHQSTTNMKADIKPKLGENGTSIPPNFKRQKVLHRNTPSSHNESKQFKAWSPKIEVNPTNAKNEIKCTFKIRNSEFNETHFQSAFLNSCPKNTNIPLDKMNQITNALSETTKRIFNNKHSASNESHPPPPHSADGRKTPDRKPVIKTEPGLDPFSNGSKAEAESDSDDLFKRLKANRKMEIPPCGCLGPGCKLIHVFL